MEISPLVTEKIFEWFLPYMGVAAILVIYGRGGHFGHVTHIKQTFVPSPQGGSTYNLAFGPLVLEEKKLSIVND